MRSYPALVLEKCSDGKATWWRLAEPAWCCDVVDGSKYVIPAGFVSNLASMPRLLYVIEPPHGRSAIPSVKHDYRYIMLVGVEKYGYRQARLHADRQYYLDLQAAGMKKYRAYLFYVGVRLGGWWPWRRHTQRRLLDLLRKEDLD